MVRRCVNYILSKQNRGSGYIGDSMYNHGFATLALAEAYGMVRDDRIGPALRKAVALTPVSYTHLLPRSYRNAMPQ